ncbi:hypothetical protein Y032_0002g841 [Ancylostoma ceylanicum]|uniref:Uncharacterized protein n=1 Tax=Ancylostoma ceylanicum TaxID=53326 RepID=A0A016W3G5_9BILA|nr:hypothetical protein Y032_0002g841 [Ancylostoma ceylanicum]
MREVSLGLGYWNCCLRSKFCLLFEKAYVYTFCEPNKTSILVGNIIFCYFATDKPAAFTTVQAKEQLPAEEKR